MDPFRHPGVGRFVRLAVEEDLGRGDVTTSVTIPPGTKAEGRVEARQQLIVAGLPIVPIVFDAVGAEVTIDFHATEGGPAARDLVLLRVRGEASALLAAERVVLNFLQRMCGVATLTRSYVNAVRETKARIVDTRKTIPDWRLLDKDAVRLGGGHNHRFGLDDGILIKDNHVAVWRIAGISGLVGW
ncbi:MAG: hypothetical protein ACREQ9_08505 [Candidatus Binatia bacterium]